MNKKAVKQATSRREMIAKAGSTVLAVVAVSAVVVMFCAMSVRFLWQKKSYNDRVIAAKTKARDEVKHNIANLDKLSSQFSALDESPTTSSKIILHALPPTYDYAALTTSMESLAKTSGVTFDGSVGNDTSSAAVKSAVTSQPVEIPMTLSVTGTYDSVVKYINNLERSIRPINVTNVILNGTNSSLKATITATTYYQPPRSLEVQKQEVK